MKQWIYGAAHIAVSLKALSHLAFVAVMFSGCTTVMYGGPRRTSDKIAVLSTSGGATIVRIDGQPTKRQALTKYEILPGRHSIEMSGITTEYGILVTVMRHSRPIEACFIADPGHGYQATVSPDEDGGWQREIREDDADQDISFDCSDRSASPSN